LETTYNTLVDFVAQTRAMCKELPTEAISACQSDISLMNQSISRIHRTLRTISEIIKNKKEKILNFDNIHAQLREIKELFSILLEQFPKFCLVLWQMKTPIVIKTK
jgi:exonuclease VII large subunit